MQKLIIATMAAVTLLPTRLEFSAQKLVESLEFTAQELVEPPDTGRAKVLVAVALFRMRAFRDTSRTDYCNAVRVVRDSLALGEVLASLPEGSALFENKGVSCEADERRGYRRRLVEVDSLTVSGRSANAFISILDPGGRTYRETYDVRQRYDGAWIVVRAEVVPGIILHPSRER